MNERVYKVYVKKLAADPVPNIRFNYAKTVAGIYKKLTNSNKMDCSGSLKRLAETDQDFDVKFYSQKALSEIGGQL